MKFLILLLSISNIVEAKTGDCTNKVKPIIVEKSKKPDVIKNEYINLIARQIFNDETDIYDFIGVHCMKASDNKKGVWDCHIRQSATKFENGRYTVNPPHVGEWMLYINFIDNIYLFK